LAKSSQNWQNTEGAQKEYITKKNVVTTTKNKKNKKKASRNTALPHIHAQSPRPEKPNARVRSAVQTFHENKKRHPFFVLTKGNK
jgi:hypothetical protein